MEDFKQNPWVVKNKVEKYDNPWINVTEHQVINPAGKPGIYGVVEIKNIAVGIIPIDANGDTYLVGQFRFPTQSYEWEIVEGGCLDETPLATAQRELKEETGLTATEFVEIQRLQTSNCITTETSVTYVAFGLTTGEANPEPSEQLTIKKLPLQEAIEWALNGNIKDAISVAGLLKVDYMIKQGLLCV